MLYGFQPSEALDLLQTNIPINEPTPIDEPTPTQHNHGPATAAEVHEPHGPTTTVEAHPTDEECATERMRLRESRKKDLLPTMSSYRPCHIDAKDAIAWAAMQAKFYYDANWQPQFFAVGDEVLLRLHCGYKLPGITNKKLERQFVGPFKVTERIGRLAYRLDLPPAWKIHNVISIAHLEPASTNDLYNRPRPTHPPSITVDGADNHYEIERLLRKRVSR